ncbi:hypothetical protein IW262DRAFT_1100357 [Armillaria fumosa]|nr:hypothetical protein IW262DRAFT_1100357 [Armillaria fumosa]
MITKSLIVAFAPIFMMSLLSIELEQSLLGCLLERSPSWEGLETRKSRIWSLWYWMFRLCLEQNRECKPLKSRSQTNIIYLLRNTCGSKQTRYEKLEISQR